MTEEQHNIVFNKSWEVSQQDSRRTVATSTIAVLSVLSIVLFCITDQIPLVWNWSLGLLSVFFFPGYAIINLFDTNKRENTPLNVLNKIGLSIILIVVIMFVLGLLNAIRLFNLIIISASITLTATLIHIWKNRGNYLIWFKNPIILLKNTDWFSWHIMKRSNWVIVLIFLFNIIFGTWLAVSNGIWRDGPFHAMIAQQMVREQNLVSFSPFNVVDVSESGRLYWPIAYPLAYHLLLAVMYMIGGEIGILVLSPILSGLSVIGVYLIVKQFYGNKLGLLSAVLFSIDTVTISVSASVFMDHLILFFAILSIIEFEKQLNYPNSFSPVFAGLWLGILASIKQTGILTAIIMTVYGFAIGLWNYKSKQSLQKLKQVILAVLIAILVAFPFLLYQYLSFGSLLYPPFSLPFMNEIWTIDSVSVDYLQRFRPEYNKQIYDILYEILLFPFPLTIWGGIASTILGGLALLGVFYTVKNKQKTFLTTFLILSSFSILFIYIFKLIIPRYFLFLRIFSVIFVLQGILQLQEFLNISIPRQRLSLNYITGGRSKKGVSFVLLILICFPILYQVNMDISLSNASDKIDSRSIPDRVDAYRQAGQWIQDNTPKDILILGGRPHEVGYYSQRDTIWIFWFGAHNIPALFRTRSAQDALIYLTDYKIDYIWLDRLQIANGFYESIPLHGFNDIIRFSPYFEKVFENEITQIFHVNYETQNIPAFFQRSHYYGSTFGGPFDFEQYQIVRLNDTNNWTPNYGGIGRNLSPDLSGFIEIQVDPNEFELTEDKTSSIPASMTFYYQDSFEGDIQISILGPEENYLNCLELVGSRSGLVQAVTVDHMDVYLSNIWSRIHYGETIISGSIVYKVQNESNSNFTLLGVLFTPGGLNDSYIPDIPLNYY